MQTIDFGTNNQEIVAQTLLSVPAQAGVPVLHESWFDMQPSWQNSLASLRRASEPYEVLGDDRGFVVVFPSNGDVPLLAVRRDQRRNGIGRSLLAAAAHRVGKPLRIMNVEDRFEPFLERIGAKKLVRQIEMVRSL
jgi:GNAT superfamily N-acetyltransferase